MEQLDYYFPQWLLANGSEVYSSYRPPPFIRIVPPFVPQQSGHLGDCGVWLCIFLERRTKGENVFNPDEDTAISAMEFSLKLARLILETRFREDQRSQGQSID